MEQQRYGSARRDNVLGMAVHRPVFLGAAALILLLVAFGSLQADALEIGADALKSAIADNMGWFYLLCMNLFLAFAVYLFFSRFAHIRLGGEDAERAFGNWGWYSMLFAAGTGVGLLFYGVAEPISFYGEPPFGTPETPQAASDAAVHAIFHWGLHGWSMYALMGLALCFFCYNRGLPLTVRSVFEPLLGDRVHGPIGNAIDILAVVGTLIGVAVSLGLGAQQINIGLAETFKLPESKALQVGLIGGITTVATISVVTGLSRGIQKLSKLAVMIGGVLIVYVLAVGPTVFLLDSLLQNTGAYLQELPKRGTYTEAYSGGRWQNQWTLFYFAWWISWSPFVGMFIARISRGRTLREYLLGVLLVPTAVSILWLTVMGNGALYQELTGTGNHILQAVLADPAKGMFAFLAGLPVADVVAVATMTLFIIAVAIFFITSSDSGSLVIDIITSGGDQDPPVPTRIFWAVLEGSVAVILLLAGGIKAMQSAATIVGLPFVMVILVMCLSLYLGLCDEWRRRGQPSAGDRPSTAKSA